MDEEKTLSFPLPLYTMLDIAPLVSRDGVPFTVVAGLSKELVEELKARSLDESDEELQKNTSDRKRFGEGSYEEWYKKDRTPFALLDAEGHLAALIWMGPESIPLAGQEDAPWDTIAFRSYAPYRGKVL